MDLTPEEIAGIASQVAQIMKAAEREENQSAFMALEDQLTSADPGFKEWYNSPMPQSMPFGDAETPRDMLERQNVCFRDRAAKLQLMAQSWNKPISAVNKFVPNCTSPMVPLIPDNGSSSCGIGGCGLAGGMTGTDISQSLLTIPLDRMSTDGVSRVRGFVNNVVNEIKSGVRMV